MARRGLTAIGPADDADEAPAVMADSPRVTPLSPIASPAALDEAPVAADGCRCEGQPFRVTRVFQGRGRLERRCDYCGALQGVVR